MLPLALPARFRIIFNRSLQSSFLFHCLFLPRVKKLKFQRGQLVMMG
ncbi:hypothetical protein SLEP1_g55111 [Rubroshorea leprosula]|uniref:Uncharacterized protein n=1 Tax=Rubroshorea leprosula TaxID=152421 RepID=A0AAV5MFM2_9ROSI|nr:hypothetical protein SLEP1_g55111 [Rubroshorea leprosula]